MDELNKLIVDHAGLALMIAFLLHVGKDFLRDFLSRDSASKLADNDPKNDGVARLEQAGSVALDRIPDPASLLNSKK